ncbi:hypothetical protein [Tunturibacter empetritectus]|uniref:Uncharacterized protein n=1 Tax=Tunturiibacter lichenicola TaxID=2051959 RepID=A0A7W8J561_9BACT|nr:hypothetical protein [Edaphobacter lichenicola]MBB5342802.1 hypothetical protein [Edaphobacter lichenicola]
MRRLIAITLLLLFSSPLISPLLALTASSQANLPACCRRNGAHHCMGNMQQPDGINVSTIPQKCPSYPAAVTQIQHGDLACNAASLLFVGIVSHPSLKTQTEARARVALDRSRQKRGPPSFTL